MPGTRGDSAWHHCGVSAAFAASRRDLALAVGVVAWIAAGLALDVGAGPLRQALIGVATWLLLIAALWRETRAVQLQVGVAVAVATATEVVASLVLGLYEYRLGNVPAFVPPGHGLVYLSALALGRSQLLCVLRRPVVLIAIAAVSGWALWGVTASPRPDLLGALLALMLVAFLLRGRAPLVYAAAFVVTSYLELFGTALGTWAWVPHDPVSGLVSMGNPPSGIAGAYCVLDATALVGGAWLGTRLAGRRRLSPVEAAPS
jgi:hypothetical protein